MQQQFVEKERQLHESIECFFIGLKLHEQVNIALRMLLAANKGTKQSNPLYAKTFQTRTILMESMRMSCLVVMSVGIALPPNEQVC